jgi:Methionine synthase I, cobalamin-binding domain
MARHPQQFPRIDIPYARVLARLGYAQGKTQLDKATETLIREAVETAGKLVSAKQVVAASAVTLSGEDTVLLEPGLAVHSRKIYELLKDSVRVFGFAVTIGGALEEKRDALLTEKETARALALDAAGSVAAETLAELTQKQIAAENGKTTLRFSPGYGDWGLPGQTDFLRWLGAGQIGIRLTENFQMIPEKSVSAILGIL